MTPSQLTEVILAAAAAELADRRGHLADGLERAASTATTGLSAATAGVQRPRDPGHGDYASAIALQLAQAAGTSPRLLAAAIAERLVTDPAVRAVQVAGPGFVNIWLTTEAVGALAAGIVADGRSYGHGRALRGQRINLEFVSANPTGPISVGHLRWVAVGDALTRLLRAQGAEVVTEYYFNDAGAQIDRFAASLLAAARHEPIAEDGYQGAYVSDIAAVIAARHPGAAARPDALDVYRTEGVALMLAEIKSSLSDVGVHFDVYFSEQTLHDRNAPARALARLDELGHVYRADGALWVRTTRFGDDKDRVFRRGDGSYTYFAADCAYYLDKRSRGFDRVMMILGADHHGYLGRMRAMAACFGDDLDATLEILIGQLVSVMRDGRPVRLSRRAGNLITATDILSEIGADAARYVLARYSLDSPIDIDLGLWARRSNENPVYYLQYAHARICALQRAATRSGVNRGDSYDPALLSHACEQDLLKDLADFPAVMAAAAELRQPHRMARYLERLAGSYHRFYDACQVLPADGDPMPAVSQARLWLTEATRIVLANGLQMLGITAPAQM